MRNWTPADDQYLKDHFADTPTKNVAAYLGRTYSAIAGRATLLGIHKSEAFKKSINSGRIVPGDKKGSACYFQKGHVSFNKGLKWDQFMSRDAQKRSLATTFKKGNVPHNTKNDNEITYRNDEGRIYRYIRISKAKWMPLHVYNWQKVYGKVPEGSIIVFKSRSTENCEVDNLEMITKAENMIRNTIHRYPDEIKQTIKALTKLKKTINGKK